MKRRRINAVHNFHLEKRLISVFLILTFVVSSLGGCKSPVSTSGDDETIKDEASLLIAISSDTLAASPFFAAEGEDTALLQLTHARLLTTDRNGDIVYDAAGRETHAYKGTDYSYEGPASITASYDKAKKQTTYTIVLRDDIACSDGTLLTADDLIFTYYVLCDSSYHGYSRVSSVPIVGLEAYQCGTNQISKFKKDVQSELDKPSDKTKKLFEKQIIQKQLKQQYKWVASLYDDDNYAAYTGRYTDPKELFAYFFNLTDGYNAAGAKSKNELINDIAAQYDGDYKKLGASCGLDFTEEATAIVKGVIMDSLKKKDQVSSISGIQKIDNRTVSVTVKGKSEKDLYDLCNIYIAPLAQYGDVNLYDYEMMSYGFTKNDVSSVLEKDIPPAGGGAYALSESDDTTYTLKANSDYYKGAPKSTGLKLLRLDLADMTQVISSGAADLAICDFDKKLYDNVAAANKTETTACLLTAPKDGYVYLGINAQEVKAGNDAQSSESIALRRALLTVFAAYKAASLHGYYGNYVTPLETEYDTDADTAIDTAVELLKEAGYVYDEAGQKFTEAPKGSGEAGLSYTISVIGFEQKDHPSYQMLLDAQAALEAVGIKLQIIDEPDTNSLWKHVYEKTSQLWIFNYASVGMNTENHSYGLTDSGAEAITSNAVELPLFQRQTAILSSPSTSIAADRTAAFTSFYTLFDVIETIEADSGK